MPAQPYDPTLKTLVETEPESWPAFLGGPVGPTTVIDADIATVSGATDKVLRVAAAAPYPVHLEFVAGHDGATLPGKLHVRNALLDQRHRLPVRSAAVLLRPEADSPRLTGLWERCLPGENAYLTFRYQVMRVWQLLPERLLSGGLPLLALAPISAVTEAELPGIIERMKRRLGRARRLAREVWARRTSCWGCAILLRLRLSFFGECCPCESHRLTRQFWRRDGRKAPLRR